MSDGPSNERWDRTWEIFHEVLEHPPEARADRLAQICAGHPDLRREVEELLGAHQSGSPVLDGPPPIEVDPADLEETQVAGRGVLAAGTLLADRFEIVRLIGVGGMGEVYEARDRDLASPVAIKTLLPELSTNETALARFRREILLARQVTHRNACRLFDLFQHEDLVFLTMELLEGETLAALLRREGRLELGDSEAILRQLIAGLEAAHEVGVVHRDLKPANVILVEEPGGTRVVITDFGLATSHGGATEDAADLTRTGEVLGTPAYMAPEQLEGGEPTPATDVYALGLMLYEMVSGKRPFVGGTAFSIASRRLQGPPPSPRTHLPDLDPLWESMILRCLERDTERRFAYPRQALEALAEAGSPASPWSTIRLWRTTVILSAIALGAIGLAIWRSETGPGTAVSDSAPTSSSSPEQPVGIAPLDTILIADFDNRTGNPDLDGVVEAAFGHELAASTFVAVASRSRVHDTLRLMRLPQDSPLPPDVARDVALRDGSIRAVVTGSIDTAGPDIVLNAGLLDPADGSILDSHSANAGQGGIALAEAVGQLSRDLRVSLGEAAAAVDAAGSRERVTTHSFRALRLYEEAEAVIARSGQDATSEELLRAAIREDPEFASAHLLLGYAIFNQTRDLDATLPHLERAMELADDIPDRERYFIRASYFGLTGDNDRARANYDALLRLHPDHYWGNNNMARLVGPTAGIPYEVRKATYRPNDLDANWDAAHALAIVGNRPRDAQPFIDRVVELAAIEIPLWKDYEVAWARLWTFHRHWLDGDLDTARAVLDEWSVRLDGMSGGELLWMRQLLPPAYRTLGLIAEARSLQPLPDFRLPRRFHAGIDELLSGDPAAAAEHHTTDDWAGRWWGEALLQDPLRLASLVAAGRESDADDLIAAFDASQRAPTPDMAAPAAVQRRLMQALVTRARDDLEASARQLETVLQRDWQHYGPTYFLALTTLAEIRREQGRTEEALALLDRAVAERQRSYPFGMELWMDAQLDLAALHRSLGNEETATELEQELRDLTALADEDFWLVERLATRSGSIDRSDGATRVRSSGS